MGVKKKPVYSEPVCEVCERRHYRSMIYDNVYHWGMNEAAQPKDLLELLEGNEIHE